LERKGEKNKEKQYNGQINRKTKRKRCIGTVNAEEQDVHNEIDRKKQTGRDKDTNKQFDGLKQQKDRDRKTKGTEKQRET
jgi:hypothetical protein